jgi:hypothetical protein
MKTGMCAETTTMSQVDGKLDHNVRPELPCPVTVAVTCPGNVSYLPMAYLRREPAAFVVRADADPPHRAPQAAVKCPTTEVARRNGSPTSTDNALPIKQAQR